MATIIVQPGGARAGKLQGADLGEVLKLRLPLTCANAEKG